MKSSVDEVALQGIEFWSTVCDEEVDLAIEAAEVSLKFHALQVLSRVLNKLTEQKLFTGHCVI